MKVRFTDDGGTDEGPLTSDAYPSSGTVGTNAAPASADKTVTTNEDTAYTFQASDFAFSDTDNGDALVSVKVAALPVEGKLALNDTDVTAGDAVAAASLGGLVFTPAANGNGTGYASFTFKVSDGVSESVTYTMTINVTALNDAATGKPSLSGEARVGRTLTALTSGIADVDGVPVTLGYQWVRVDGDDETDITGETSSTYTLVAADNGKKVKVKVRFTDDGGTDEGPLTSDAYPSSGTVGTNAAPASADKTVTTNEDTAYTFQASDFAFSDTDNGDALVSVKVAALPVEGKLALNDTDVTAGDAVAAASLGGLVFTPAANGNGTGYASFTFKVSDGVSESVTYTMTINVTALNDAATGKPSLSGEARVGRTLTALTSGIADVDGVPVTLGYQWVRVDGSNETDITGETSSTYTLVAADNGKKVKVKVRFTDDGGTDEGPLTSDAYPSSGTVGTNAAPASADKTVTTNEDTAYTFQASDFAFSDTDNGDALVSVKVAALPVEGKLALDDTDVTAGDAVAAASLGGLVFTPAANGNGTGYASFTFKVSDGVSESVTYTMTINVTALNDAAMGKPSISGEARVGRTLTAATSGIADIDGKMKAEAGDAGFAYTYQWVRVDGDDETDISGATSDSYVLAADDNGKKVKVKVSFTDDGDTDEGPLTSAAYPSGTTVGTNAAPASEHKTVTTAEDTAYTFQVSDFAFTDTDSSDALVSVTVAMLPGAGKLTLDGAPVAVDQAVAADALGNLVFTPAPNGNGTGYASFTFKVSDGATESAAYTLTIDVTALNDAATGQPSITGTATVGRTLMAATSGIADIDGKMKAEAGDAGFAYTYQWVRVDGDDETDISGATSDSYVLAADDNGKQVKVKVSFTDDGDTDEGPLTSAAYPSGTTVGTNAAPTSEHKTVTTAEDTAYTFQVSDFAFTDTDSSDALVSVTVAMLPGAGKLALDGAPVTADQAVAADALGNLVFTPAPNGNGTGYASFTFKVSDGATESAAYTLTIDVTALNDAATGQPSITGTATVGRTLMAATSGIADIDGKMKAEAGDAGFAYTYQWVRVDGDDETDISGATSDSYVLAADDNGKKVKVKVSFTDDGDTDEGPLTSAAYPSGTTVGTNAAPASADKTVTTNEDTAYTFQASDFAFSDTDSSDALVSVTVAMLPGAGKLALDGAPVTADQAVAADALGNLVFTPAPNGNGTGYASFTFKVSDGATESAAYTLTVTVTALNDAATGQPSITGTATVGRTLMAATSGIADIDGKMKAEAGDAGFAYTYQWVRVDGDDETDISGATSDSYVLAADDNGKKVKVKVSFTDDGDTDEGPLTSAAYPSGTTVGTNAAPTSEHKTVTTAEDTAYTFQVSDFAFTDTDTGDALVSVTVVTLPGAGKLTLDGAPVTADQAVAADALGNLVFTPAPNGNGTGYASFTFKVSDGVSESVAYTLTVNVTPVNDAATGQPSITGTATVGRTLMAATSGIADIDGKMKAEAGDAGFAYTYQWVRVDGDDETDISGATSDSYVLAADDNGKKVKVKVSFTDDGDTDEGPLTSAAYPSGTTVGTNAAPASADKTVTTNEDTAYTFQASDFAFSDTDSSDALVSVTVAMLPGAGKLTLDGAPVTADQAVAADALGNLVFTPAPNGNGTGYASFTFKVSDGVSESVAYTLTVTVTALNDAATGQPSITGTALVGQTLTASTSDIADIDGKMKAEAGDTGFAYTYQWVRVDGMTETDISGETSDSYVLVADDNGKQVKVKVRFTDDGNTDEGPLTSAAYPSTGSVMTPTVTVAAGGEVDEGDDAEFTLTLSAAAPTGGQSVSYSLALTNPNPVADRAHVAAANLGAKTATVGAGETTATVTVATVDVADLVSKNSTLTLSLTAGSGYTLGSTAAAEVTIDDTTTATVTYSGGACSATVGEADGRVNLGIQLDKDVAFQIGVLLVNIPASAAAGNDYVAADADGALEFPALTRTSNFQIGITDNQQLEGDETFDIKLFRNGLDAAVIINTGCQGDFLTVTITDDDTAALSISAPTPVTEGSNIRVTVAPPTGSCLIPFPVTVTLTPSGDTNGLGSADAKSLRLPRCSSGTANFATANDSVKTAERSLLFTLSLPDGTASGITLPATPSAAVTVTDDETLKVTGVAVSSTPSSGSTYGAGETLSFTATFNGPVTVTGTPQLPFSLGGVTRQAAYASGSDSAALVFSYTVVAGDNDADGVSWAADALSLNGGTIKFMTGVAANRVDAALIHAAKTAQSGHKVDTPPVLSTPTVNGAALVLTYNEALDTGSKPASSAFTVKVGGTAVSLASSGAVAVAGRTLTLTLAAAVTAADTVTVSYAVPGSNPLQDAGGTDAPAFTDLAVTNGTGNTAPAFANATAARSFTETVGDATEAAARDVGAVVTATDADADTLTYSLEGTDAAKFTVNSSSGQIRTKAGERYDREAKVSYSVRVKADDGNSGTGTVAVTITLANAVEIPLAPGMPAVAATSGSTTRLDVSWSPPANTGRPALSGYKLQYRQGSSGAWTDHAHSGTGTTATIASLTAATAYEVQVLAVNADGDGAWSASGAGTTGSSSNNAPEFSDTAAARSFTETVGDAVAAASNVGDAVAATDADGDTLTYTLEGADAAKFGIVSTSGQIQTKTGERYDREAKASYAVRVKADDGNSGTDTVAVTISVANAVEIPLAPGMPAVAATSGSTTSLDVSWAAPANTGRPALSGYKLRYRTGSGAWTDHSHTGVGTSATIASLSEDTDYEVQVRALNADGDGEWSGSGSATTGTVVVPGATRNLAVAAGDAQVVLTWTVPASDGGGAITTYRYRYAAGSAVPSGVSWRDVPDSNNDGDRADEREVTVTGLVNETEYAFEVQALNSAGEGPAAGARATPVEDPNLPSRVIDLRAVVSGNTVELTWAAPARSGSGRIARYEYRHAPGSTVPSGTGWRSAAARRFSGAYVDGLENGRRHAFEVRAVNAHGYKGAAATLTATPRAQAAQTLPTAPRGLRAAGSLYSGMALGRVTLNWEAPSNLGNSLLVRYEYRYAARGESLSSAAWNHGPISERTTIVRNLAVGTSYTFQLRAVTGAGAGAFAAVGVSTPRSTRLNLSVFTRGAAVEGETLTIGVRRSGIPASDEGVLAVVEIYDSAGARWNVKAVDIAVGAREGTVEFRVPFDGQRGAARELAVTLSPGSWDPLSSYIVGTPASATAPVRNRDPLLRVANASVREGPQAQLSFDVSLDRAAARAVTVDYATADGTATAGADYTATSDTLSFAAGETAKTVLVPVLDDAHDEGIETLTLTLSNARGALLDAATATGRIVNTDPMPAAWLARFGRTGATQVLGLLDARFDEARAPASQLTLGGRPVNLSGLRGDKQGRADPSAGSAPAHTDPAAVPDPAAGRTAASPLTLRGGSQGRADPGAEPAPADADPFDVLASRYTLDDTSWGIADLNSGPAARHADPAADPGAVGGAGEATLLERLAWRLLTRGGWSVDRRQFLSGSSFDLSLSALGRETDAEAIETARVRETPGHWSMWGRGALVRFTGQDRGLSLDGDVLTGLLGLDYSRGRWLAGVGLAYNDGDGAYRASDSGATGELDSTLVSVHPYLHYALTERLSAWGTLGYGAGGMSLRPGRDGANEQAPLETDIQMRMGALGLRGIVFADAATELALKSDLMWVRTTSSATAGLAPVDGADASRVRLLLTGRHRHVLATGAALTPNVELGLRYDDGDAETGAGVELGGGLRYADPVRGLTVEAAARALLAHEAGGYEEWGLSGSLQLDPGRLGRGLSLRLASGWGLTDSSTETLWQQQTASGLARGPGQTPQGRIRAEWAYGLDVPRTHGLLTPYGSVEMAGGGGRTLALGWRFELGQSLSLSLAGERREALYSRPEHALMLQTTLPW